MVWKERVINIDLYRYIKTDGFARAVKRRIRRQGKNITHRVAQHF